VGKYGLENALFPIGNGFLEGDMVVACGMRFYIV
jgi:hypothetical protein